jgi:protein O-GlcNAc transferase
MPTPDSPEICRLMQTALELHRARQLARAEAVYRQILAQVPDYTEAHYALGNAYYELGREGLAIACYQRAIACNPAFFRAHYNLGYLYRKQGKINEAVACFRQSTILDPRNAEAYFNLANALLLQRRPDEVAAACSQGLALKPRSADGHHYLGFAHLFRGDPDAAIASCEGALECKPDDARAFDTLLCAMLYRARSTPGEILAAHRRYAAQFETPLKAQWGPHHNHRDPGGRLKVGYVSADFRTHSVAFFIEALLAHHDRSTVETYCYHTHGVRDAVTERLATLADHWVPSAGLSDGDLAERLRADEIDILVDLSGHTGFNRLLTFARRPAPVQVTYLGYPATTGLSAMDYRLVTWETDPAGSEAWHTERLYRLPRTLWCYRPGPDCPAVGGETPASRNGFVTFGSMNNLAKISEETIAVWGELLRELPGSRLVMTNVPEGTARDLLRERFAAQGISGDRLSLHLKLPADRFWALSSQIDIALDPFPYNGTTTTCEALWMGLPVITLIGETSVSRSGYALLKGVGLEELCAKDVAGYVRIAVGLARDLSRLAALRQGMRARVEASPLRDEAGFARDIEAAYREMWREWCDT